MQHCKSRPLHHSGLWDINWISNGKRRGNRETEIQIIKGPLTSNCLSLGTSRKTFWYAWWLNLSLIVALRWDICTFTFSPVWLPYSLFWLKRCDLQLCNVPCDASVCTQISCKVAVCNSGGRSLGVEDFHVCMHAVRSHACRSDSLYTNQLCNVGMGWQSQTASSHCMGKGGNSKKACVSGCKVMWDDASGTVKTSLLQLLKWQHALHWLTMRMSQKRNTNDKLFAIVMRWV